MRKQTLLRNTYLSNGIRFSGRLGMHGRPMRDPEGHEAGGGESQGGGDNQGGNSGNSGGQNGNGGTQGNNTGAEFDGSSFWNSPADEGAASGNGGSAGGSSQQGTQGGGNQQQQNEGNAFKTALDSMSFGNQQVFTPEAVEAMNNGDPKNFNDNMTTFGREVTRQAVIMAAQLMQKNNGSLEQKFEQMMEARFGSRDTEADLGKAIPSYSNAGVKPIVDGIMAQALKLTKGKRPEAIEMTKQMLQFQAKSLGQDFGITTPPGGNGNDFGTGQNTNWEEELLGR